jgi:hypothetical protein
MTCQHCATRQKSLTDRNGMPSIELSSRAGARPPLPPAAPAPPKTLAPAGVFFLTSMSQLAAPLAVAGAGGRACNPSSFGIGADPGHHEHRSPSTIVPNEASGWRSTVRRSMARLVPQPGQKTSSHGVPASSAARIVGDQSMSRPAPSCPFQRSITALASTRAALSAASRAAPALMSSPRIFAGA